MFYQLFCTKCVWKEQKAGGPELLDEVGGMRRGNPLPQKTFSIAVMLVLEKALRAEGQLLVARDNKVNFIPDWIAL